MLGMRVNEDSDDWVVIGLRPGMRQLAFQKSADWLAPSWPDPALSNCTSTFGSTTSGSTPLNAPFSNSAPPVSERLRRPATGCLRSVGHPFCLVFGHLSS